MQQVRRRFDVFIGFPFPLLRNQLPSATNEKHYGNKQTLLIAFQIRSATNKKAIWEKADPAFVFPPTEGKKKNGASASEARVNVVHSLYLWLIFKSAVQQIKKQYGKKQILLLFFLHQREKRKTVRAPAKHE